MRHFILEIVILSLVSCSVDSAVSSNPTEEKQDVKVINNEDHFTLDRLSDEEISVIESELSKDTFFLYTKELEPDIVDTYSGTVQKLYHHRRDSLEHFIRTILVANRTIKEIVHSKGKIVMDVYGNDSLDYFEKAPFLNYSWRYYYAHDIYASFFSYPEIDSVVLLVEGINNTWLPTSGETDGFRLENGVMLRKWYIPSLDYFSEDVIDIDNQDHFSDYGKFIVNSEVLDSILNVK